MRIHSTVSSSSMVATCDRLRIDGFSVLLWSRRSSVSLMVGVGRGGQELYLREHSRNGAHSRRFRRKPFGYEFSVHSSAVHSCPCWSPASPWAVALTPWARAAWGRRWGWQWQEGFYRAWHLGGAACVLCLCRGLCVHLRLLLVVVG